MDAKIIKNIFKIFNFKNISYLYVSKGILFIVEKDYSNNFNFDFDGKVKLKVMIYFDIAKALYINTYPTFYELSDKIPKKAVNHIYSNGNICYAPPRKPLEEKWQLSDFISAVDAMINNYFSLEYRGKGLLIELEHDYLGLKQYNTILKNHSQKKSS